MRIILQYKRYSKVEHILQILQFMSIKQRLYYVCTLIFKILNDMTPELRNKLYIVWIESKRQDTANRGYCNKIPQNKKYKKEYVLWRSFMKMCNVLSYEVKQYERLEPFKRVLKEYMLGKNAQHIYSIYSKLKELQFC